MWERTADSLAPPERQGPGTGDIADWWLKRFKVRLYPKQLEMVEAVLAERQTSVCGCNASGKDFVAGRVALWWVCYWHERNKDAMVIITGPTNRQVEFVVWQNLRAAYVQNDGERQFGGHLYEVPYLRWSEESFIYAFSTDRDYQLQGFHSGRLLVIITEAHGMEQSHIDAIHRLNPYRLLMTGNPISEAGEFYDSHHGKKRNWHAIEIDAFDTPNLINHLEGNPERIPGLITWEDVQTHKENWGEDDPRYLITVLNKWVSGMGDLVVIPRSLAEDGEKNYKDRRYEPGEVEVVGVDVARSGLDSTVIASRRGRSVKFLAHIIGQDTMDIADWVHNYLVDHPAAHCVVDGVGIGAGVVDRLRRLGHGIIDFQSGQNADDSLHYYNKIAEVWWRMREQYIRGLSVEPNEELLEQLGGRKYKIMSDKRITLQTKEEMKREGKHSPDDADALALTFAVAYNLEGSPRVAFSDADFAKLKDPEKDDHPRTITFGTASEYRTAARELGFATVDSKGRWSRLGRGTRGLTIASRNARDQRR